MERRVIFADRLGTMMGSGRFACGGGLEYGQSKRFLDSLADWEVGRPAGGPVEHNLPRTRHLLAELGNPETSFRSVIVGGTNGKGSVVAMLDAMLRAAGYRTGRFTSPHLCSVRERFLIHGECIGAEALDGHIEFFRAIARQMDRSPTFFELNTAIAFRHFAEESVDVALVSGLLSSAPA